MSFVINQKIKYNVVQEREIFFDNERLAQLNKYIHKNYDIDENFECTMEDVRQAFDISNIPLFTHCFTNVFIESSFVFIYIRFTMSILLS